MAICPASCSSLTAPGAGVEAAAPAGSSAARGTAGLPAVIVVPEIDGFCAGTVAAARRLAEAGYVALALDLYAPYGSAPELRGYEDTIAWLDRLNDRRQVSDLVQALGLAEEACRVPIRPAWP